MVHQFKTFKICSFINICAAVLFSLFSISFHADLSLLAFPLSVIYTAVVFLFYIRKLVIKKDGSHIYGKLKLIEYLPYFMFVTFILRRSGNFEVPYAVDVIQVLLWACIFFLSLFTSRMLYPKKNTKVVEVLESKPDFSKPKGIKRFYFEVIDWIDSIVWACFTVLIFQIFVLQLYEIPSESMVPTFLIKDKVFVSKIDCAPKFPLTDVGFPGIRNYKRGDTIVLRNPHYTLDRKSEVKTVTSNLIRMLTFMTVNIDKDEKGEIKADPLVKRITGLPGEQIVMQDGTLYYRTKESNEFKKAETDAKFAQWNLNNVDASIKNKVEYYPLSDEDYAKMLSIEENRRNFDLDEAADKVNKMLLEMERIVAFQDKMGKFEKPSMYEFDLFKDTFNIASDILCKEDGFEWFKSFMTSWIASKNEPKDFYAESNYRLNVMIKMTLGEMIYNYVRISSGYEENDSISMKKVQSYLSNSENLHWYVQGLLDERNMPLFPANDENGNPQYIPENCYFMMGDNRFNSLDLRHSYDRNLSPLSSYDSLSVEYMSMMAPQYINKKHIVGKPIFRFWPLNRIGKV